MSLNAQSLNLALRVTRTQAFVLVITVLSVNFSANARPDILQAWEQRYPNSASNRRDCQLCHQHTYGGDGWNSYGFNIRFQLNEVFGSVDINAAFEAVEKFNSDGDAQGLNNLEEIELGLDPGWVSAPRNPIFFKDTPTLENQPSPFNDTDGLTSDELCIPIKAKSGSAAIICL